MHEEKASSTPAGSAPEPPPTSNEKIGTTGIPVPRHPETKAGRGDEMNARPTRNAPAMPNGTRDEEVSKFIKLGLLLVLCLQNAVYTMLRRYSVGVLGEKWSSSSVLMMGEVIKLIFSIFMTLADKGASSAEGTGLMKLWWLVRASPPMAIPAVVFWLMNLLSYVSLKRLDSSTFTVFAQMKILMTAVFSVIMMGRRFHVRKWRALVLLVLGVALVANGSYVSGREEGGTEDKFQYLVGVVAVVTEVTLSGFVSVFFEKVLKSRVVNLSVWDRNFQLAMYSIAFYLPVALNDEGGIFDGWTANAAALAVLGSAGGILVALTMKYTDAVLKTFATSGAIIVTAVAGFMLLDAPLDVPIGVGACCTVLSLLNYSDDGGSSSSSPAGESGKGAGQATGAIAVPGRKGYDDEATSSLIPRTRSSEDSAA